MHKLTEGCVHFSIRSFHLRTWVSTKSLVNFSKEKIKKRAPSQATYAIEKTPSISIFLKDYQKVISTL